MFAVFIEGSAVYGYKPIDYEGEDDTFQLPYRLYETLPEELTNVPEGHFVQFDPDTKTFHHEPIPQEPEPQPTPEQQRIEQLEDESAMLALELMDTQIALDQTQQEQAALLLELIDKEVL